jgi:putative tryptophan/tyrosine transport system substrate-binding protein
MCYRYLSRPAALTGEAIAGLKKRDVLMKRREFLMAAAWSVAAGRNAVAQQAKVWRVGMLHAGSWDTPGDAALFEAFQKRMAELRYTEGKNLILEKRSGKGVTERLAALAEELVAFRPDVIVAVATPAVAAAQRATSSIPIVMTPAGDPLASGFIKSLAHPGGNTTGLAGIFPDLAAKSVEFLHELLPHADKIAVLMSSNPTHARRPIP